MPASLLRLRRPDRRAIRASFGTALTNISLKNNRMSGAIMFRKWQGWLDRIWRDQLYGLMVNRHIFQQVNSCTKKYAKSHVGADISHFMVDGYVTLASTAIRRMIEPPNPNPKWRCVSLRILLEDLKSHQQLLTFGRFHRMYIRKMQRAVGLSVAQEQARKDFYRVTRNKKGSCVSASRIDRDIAAITRAARPVKRLVDKVVAHTEEDKRKRGRTKFADLDRAIDVLEETYSRYYLLINRSDWSADALLDDTDVTPDLKKIWP